jgi:hypothetical protein
MKKPVIIGSMFLLSMGIFAQDGGFSYQDKVFHKDVVLKPKYDEVLIQYSTNPEQGRQKLSAKSVAGIFGTEIREKASGPELGIYALNDASKFGYIYEELLRIPGNAAISPSLIDAEGNRLFYIPNELTVQFNPQLKESEIHEVINKMGCSIVKKQYTKGYYRLKLDKGKDLNSAINAFNSRNDVVFSELTYVGSIELTSNPNDTYFGEQWSLDNTGQSGGTKNADLYIQEAWAITSGDPKVKVCVLDAGFDMNQEDLIINYYQNLGEDADRDNKTLEADGSYDMTGGIPNLGDVNYVDNDGNGYIDDLSGFNFFESYYDVNEHYHGTACAGIIAAVRNNNKGISGIAPACKIIPLKISTLTAVLADRVDALNYCTIVQSSENIIVVSCSWITDGDYIAVHEAIKNVRNKGIPLFFSVGNEDNHNCATDCSYFPDVKFPSRYIETISVGATNRNDYRWAETTTTLGSNRGPGISLTAPGAAGTIRTTYPSNTYQLFGMTSAATPAAAAVAALLLSNDNTLTPWQIQERMQYSADKVGGYNYNYDPLKPGHSLDVGYGRINAFKALISQSFRNENESNNTYTYADGPVLNNMNVSGNISTAGESDWFFFDIQQTSAASIRLFGKNKNWTLYSDPAGNPLSTGSIGTDEGVITFSTGSRSAGRYYLKISSNTTGYYDFTLSGNVSTSALYETEPNNTSTLSDGLINPNQIVSAKLVTTSDVDWYWFEATATGTITVTSTTSGKTWSLYSNPSGSALKTATGTSSYNITSIGRYYIKYSGTAGAYNFKVTGNLAPCNFETEYNNDYVSADGPISSGQRFSGKLSSSNDADWFYLDVNQAGSITLKLDGNYKSLDLYSDPYGSYINRLSVGSQGSASANFTINQAGRYYIKVTGYADAYYFTVTGNLTSKEAIEEITEEIMPENRINRGPLTFIENYPNPFSELTTIEFELNEGSFVDLKVFNLMGQEVQTLKHENMEQGLHSITWNATNSHGIMVENGVYLLRIEAGGITQCHHIVIMR